MGDFFYRSAWILNEACNEKGNFRDSFSKKHGFANYMAPRRKRGKPILMGWAVPMYELPIFHHGPRSLRALSQSRTSQPVPTVSGILLTQPDVSTYASKDKELFVATTWQAFRIRAFTLRYYVIQLAPQLQRGDFYRIHE